MIKILLYKMYTCKDCNAYFIKWRGYCTCGSYNILQDIIKEETNNEPSQEIIIDFSEFNRVCTLYTKSIILIGGEPGIGKSTLVTQLAMIISKKYICLYLVGEECISAVHKRIERMYNISNHSINIIEFFHIATLENYVKKYNPNFVIIDSLYTTRSEDNDILLFISQICKKYNFCILVISHVTKEGIIAGPKTIEHMVDVVLYLEGDRYQNIRFLRAIKNRFGPTGDTGMFLLEENGLNEIIDSATYFIQNKSVAGSVIYVSGTRPFLVEIQALVINSEYPQIESIGFTSKRLRMIIAILNKWCCTKIKMHDIFINCVGGIKIEDPAADLAVAIAIYSSLKNKVIKSNLCFFGELGLTGEIRSVTQSNIRKKEAERVGFKVLEYKNLNDLLKAL